MARLLTFVLCGVTLMFGMVPGYVSAQDGAPPAPTVEGCSPACRSGFMCKRGVCVSACNPPCGKGQTCRADGECVSETHESGQIWVAPNAAQFAAAGRQPANAGWANLAGVVGLLSAAGVAALTVGTILERGDIKSAYMGGGAGGLLALAGPITAAGAASARTNPMIQGLPTLRALSWFGYTLSLIGGVGVGVATVASDDQRVPVGWTAVFGTLGAASLIGFAIDAFDSAADANSPVGRAKNQGPSMAPSLALSRDMQGNLAPGLGLNGVF